MIIGISGKDSFRSRQYLHKLEQSFHSKYDSQGLASRRLDGRTITPEKLHQGIFGGGLFNQKQLVVIERFFEQSGQQKMIEDINDRFERLKKDKDSIIIFWEEIDKPKGKIPLFAAIMKLPISRRFDLLAPHEVKKWINDTFQREKRSGAPDLPQFLLEMCGNDLWRLHNEIEKIINFTSEAYITLEHVRRILSHSFQENSFLFVDALVKKNSQQAIYILEEQWKSDVYPLALLGSIIWQFRTIIMIKESLEDHHHPDTLGKKLKLHPFVVKKNIPAAKNFTWPELKTIYHSLQSLDEKIKTGRGQPKAELSLFVMKVCGFERVR